MSQHLSSKSGISFAFPARVGDYLLEPACIGEGSDACVLRAVHVSSGQRVAVKIVDVADKPELRDRALVEASALALLSPSCASIIRFFKLVEQSSVLYLFMELGHQDMASYIHRRGRLDERCARYHFQQALVAVSHCHRHGYIHHDIKLENFLLMEDGTLRLVDFGLSRLVAPLAQLTDHFGGSPLFMAPEILRLLPHDHRVDIWALGVCLYVMVTDSFPWEADSFSDLESKVLLEPVSFPPNFGISSQLQSLLSSMLEKDPERRISLLSLIHI